MKGVRTLVCMIWRRLGPSGWILLSSATVYDQLMNELLLVVLGFHSFSLQTIYM
jgi:hypothetical protein